MVKLTRAEEEIMQYFWTLGPNTVSGIIEHMDGDKPPHSSISSIVRILERKGFLDHKAYGRTYEYFPVITKRAYSKFSLKNLVSNYFQGSMNELVSFIVSEEDMSIKDIASLYETPKEEENE